MSVSQFPATSRYTSIGIAYLDAPYGGRIPYLKRWIQPARETAAVLAENVVMAPARQLVCVRGGGSPFDGLHYVISVTHEISPGSYQQKFTLSRDCLLPTVQAMWP